MEIEADKLEVSSHARVGRIAYRHTIIFTHNGVEKVRVIGIPLGELCEEFAREAVLRDFGIVVDEIIQIV